MQPFLALGPPPEGDRNRFIRRLLGNGCPRRYRWLTPSAALFGAPATVELERMEKAFALAGDASAEDLEI